jgi:GTP cyclohydrolase II
VECAQRGGVGVIVYFQKEGRSLGEVTKFRVYNARKRQPGGDRPDKYFQQTESIAGIRDARFQARVARAPARTCRASTPHVHRTPQELMPDVLLWLGITRIDWLLSMSSDK